MKKCGIYKITNIMNGKIIVGKSIDIDQRWVNHKNKLRRNDHENPYLQNAWNKYGEHSFKMEMILLCDQEKLDEEEIRLIKELDSMNRYKGYNCTAGGTSPSLSPKIREKIRQSLIGQPCSEEKKQKLREYSGEKHSQFGTHRSTTTKSKIGSGNKGKVRSQEQKDFLRSINLGKKHSKESILKMRNANLGKHLSEQTKQKLRNRKYSEESKKKISDSIKKHWEIRRKKAGQINQPSSVS